MFSWEKLYKWWILWIGKVSVIFEIVREILDLVRSLRGQEDEEDLEIGICCGNFWYELNKNLA